MSSTNFDHTGNPSGGGASVAGGSDSIKVALFSTDQSLIGNLSAALGGDSRFALEVSGTDYQGMSTWLLGHPVALAIIDVEPPTNVGIRAIGLISALRPHIQMMALMSRRSLDAATVAVQAGAQSCLLKETTGSSDVIAALNGLTVGSNAISPRIARVLINRFRQLH